MFKCVLQKTAVACCTGLWLFMETDYGTSLLWTLFFKANASDPFSQIGFMHPVQQIEINSVEFSTKTKQTKKKFWRRCGYFQRHSDCSVQNSRVQCLTWKWIFWLFVWYTTNTLAHLLLINNWTKEHLHGEQIETAFRLLQTQHEYFRKVRSEKNGRFSYTWHDRIRLLLSAILTSLPFTGISHSD